MKVAILKSLDVIAEIDKDVAPIVSNLAASEQPTPVPKSAYVADIIVLLTDGVNNAGPSPVAAAQQAVDRGVRIYTIGFGMANGASSSSGSSTEKDETTLKQVAAMTGGEYYSATSVEELEHVFQQLPTYLITKHKTTEISVAFAAIGTFLATVAIGLSLRWHALP